MQMRVYNSSSENPLYSTKAAECMYVLDIRSKPLQIDTRVSYFSHFT